MSELTKRLRAARGYADLTQPDVAKRLGIGDSTYKRIELGKFPQGFALDGFLRAMAKTTGLPLAFFTVDLQRIPELAVGDAIVMDDAQLRAFAQLLPEAAALAQELRRAREANESQTDEPDQPGLGPGGGGA